MAQRAPEFRLRRTETPEGAVILRLVGILDAHGVPELLTAATQVREEQRSIRLDLSGILGLSVSGLGVLLAVAGDHADAGLECTVIDSSPVVRSLFKIRGVAAFWAGQGGSSDGKAA